MKTVLMKVTPELAAQWLKVNTNNRRVYWGHVTALKNAFLRGEGRTTHQGIAFYIDGSLADGQHRLLAISMMPDGFYLEMNVTFDLPKESRQAIDTQVQPRSTSDSLGIDRRVGETANFLAAIYTGRYSGITPTLVEPFVQFIQPEIGDLTAFCPTTAKTWSSSPFKAAAIIKMKYGDPDYVKLVYASLVRKEFNDMPSSAQSLFKAYVAGSIKAAQKNDTFARALKVFDEKNSKLVKIQINDVNAVIEDTRALLHKAIFANQR